MLSCLCAGWRTMRPQRRGVPVGERSHPQMNVEPPSGARRWAALLDLLHVARVSHGSVSTPLSYRRTAPHF